MSDKPGMKSDADLTLVFYGRPAVGKSALMGEIADFLLSKGCEVVCLEGDVGTKKKRRDIPPPDRFNNCKLRVKLVEQHGDRADQLAKLSR